MEKDTQPRVRVSPLTVIVAAKDAIARLTLAGFLSCEGYRVFEAEDLNAAISWIDSIRDFDVLFADFDIHECSALIRHALETTPRIVVIGMEGNDAIPVVSDLSSRGIQACLRKPLLYSDVRQALNQTVERHGAA
jgi:DNA-binding NtrC family response regulator